MTWRGVLVIGAVAALSTVWFEADRVHHPPPGVAAVPETPVQGPPQQPPPRWPLAGGAQATALASYHLRGRVLSACRYRYDAGAKYAPVDLALGWGRMSDWAVYAPLAVSQRGRFYIYEWGSAGPPIPRREIELHSANNHVVPADDTVRKTLEAVRRDDIVCIDGSLVEIRAPDGSRWRSSLTREDTGGNSCELIRATHITIEPSDRRWMF